MLIPKVATATAREILEFFHPTHALHSVTRVFWEKSEVGIQYVVMFCSCDDVLAILSPEVFGMTDTLTAVYERIKQFTPLAPKVT